MGLCQKPFERSLLFDLAGILDHWPYKSTFRWQPSSSTRFHPQEELSLCHSPAGPLARGRAGPKPADSRSSKSTPKLFTFCE